MPVPGAGWGGGILCGCAAMEQHLRSGNVASTCSEVALWKTITSRAQPVCCIEPAEPPLEHLFSTRPKVIQEKPCPDSLPEGSLVKLSHPCHELAWGMCENAALTLPTTLLQKLKCFHCTKQCISLQNNSADCLHFCSSLAYITVSSFGFLSAGGTIKYCSWCTRPAQGIPAPIKEPFLCIGGTGFG